MRRRADVARDQRVADSARRNALAIEDDLRDRFRSDTVLGSDSRQQRHVSSAALAEAEIVSGDHPRGADPLGEHLGDELLGVHRGELRAELEHQHRVGAIAGEQRLALIERHQAEGRDVGLEEADRVRVEGGDDDRPPLMEAARDRAAHHRLVAEVESVEIAERENAPLQLIGDPAGEGKPLHWRASLSGLEGASATGGIRGLQARSRTDRRC